MARIEGAQPRQHGFFGGLVLRMVFGAVKRKLGRMVEPTAIAGHRPRILFGTAMMEAAYLGANAAPAKLKALCSVRAGSLVGCPY